MYHHLEGRLIEKSPTSVILDVRGIGFFLQTPVSTYFGLPAVGSEARLLTHFLVREDAQLLFGFLTEEERELFRMLISINGIGPKVAMTALSGVPIPELKQAIADGSTAVLTSIPGIGRKTAERLIVELKEKIIAEKRVSAVPAGPAARPDKSAEDTLSALMSLGYRRNQAKAAVDKVIQEKGGALPVEDLIRSALKHV